MNKKQVITVSVDPAVLKRIDRLCEGMDISRSSFFERAGKRLAEQQEGFMSEMESPVWRAIYGSLANPTALSAIAKLVGDHLPEEEKQEIVANVRKQSMRGKERASKKRSSKRKEK